MKFLKVTLIGMITSIVAVSAFAGTADIQVNNNTPYNAGVAYATHRPNQHWVNHHIVVGPHHVWNHKYHARRFSMAVIRVHAEGRRVGPRHFAPCNLHVTERYPHGKITVNIHGNHRGHGLLGCVANRWK